MSVCLLRIRDGRDAYHEASLASAQEMLPVFDEIVTIDDRAHELGFAGAIADGWRQVLGTGCDWVMHLELDFTFNAPVDVHRMIEVLQRRWDIAQIVLKRQAVNAEEKAAGGIVEVHPADFTQIHDGGCVLTTHRRFWSTNPSIYSTRWCRLGWPQQQHSEGVFTHQLLADPVLRFAFWGAKHAPPLVRHIGDIRAGGGY